MTNQPNRWHPSTSTGKRWNAGKAARPCSVDGCERPRYQSPAGWVNLRCREHEAELHRERWAATHPGARTYRRRAAGLGALADAVAAQAS